MSDDEYPILIAGVSLIGLSTALFLDHPASVPSWSSVIQARLFITVPAALLHTKCPRAHRAPPDGIE